GIRVLIVTGVQTCALPIWLIGYSLSQAMTVRVTANATAVADLTLAPSAATLEAVVVSGYVPGRAANGVVRIRGATAAASRADARSEERRAGEDGRARRWEK